mmetsp:Transcript_32528/g.95865  ORF Transcript_32528/g.95865 Transcript_32528/m.95865 type:complete len:303 (+) Transcript_32528:850-1758(+)
MASCPSSRSKASRRECSPSLSRRRNVAAPGVFYSPAVPLLPRATTTTRLKASHSLSSSRARNVTPEGPPEPEGAPSSVESPVRASSSGERLSTDDVPVVMQPRNSDLRGLAPIAVLTGVERKADVPPKTLTSSRSSKRRASKKSLRSLSPSPRFSTAPKAPPPARATRVCAAAAQGAPVLAYRPVSVYPRSASAMRLSTFAARQTVEAIPTTSARIRATHCWRSPSPQQQPTAPSTLSSWAFATAPLSLVLKRSSTSKPRSSSTSTASRNAKPTTNGRLALPSSAARIVGVASTKTLRRLNL